MLRDLERRRVRDVGRGDRAKSASSESRRRCLESSKACRVAVAWKRSKCRPPLSGRLFSSIVSRSANPVRLDNVIFLSYELQRTDRLPSQSTTSPRSRRLGCHSTLPLARMAPPAPPPPRRLDASPVLLPTSPRPRATSKKSDERVVPQAGRPKINNLKAPPLSHHSAAVDPSTESVCVFSLSLAAALKLTPYYRKHRYELNEKLGVGSFGVVYKA